MFEDEFVVAAGCQWLGGSHHEHFVAGAHGVAARRFPLQNLGRPPIHRRRRHRHQRRNVELDRPHTGTGWPHFHARGGLQIEIAADGGFDAVIGKRQIGRARRGLVAHRSRLEAGPGIQEQPVVAAGHLAGDDGFGPQGIVHHIKGAEIRTVEHGGKNTLVVCRAIEQIQHQPGLIAGAQVVQHGRELFVQQGADLGRAPVGGIGGKLRQNRFISAAGEQEHSGAEMFVQVGRAGVGSQRAPLRAIGRQQNHLGVAAFHIGYEHRRDTFASHRPAENQVAVGEIDLDVFNGQGEIADAVALLAIEAVLADGAGQAVGFSRPYRRGETQCEPQLPANHAYSLLQRGAMRWRGECLKSALKKRQRRGTLADMNSEQAFYVFLDGFEGWLGLLHVRLPVDFQPVSGIEPVVEKMHVLAVDSA